MLTCMTILFEIQMTINAPYGPPDIKYVVSTLQDKQNPFKTLTKSLRNYLREKGVPKGLLWHLYLA